jgi:hypothetical protein
MRKYLIIIILLLGTISLDAQALQHKPGQLFLSPELSFGTSFIVNQNNYGYSEMGYLLTYGAQYGAMIGWDNYLQKSFKTGIIVSQWGQRYQEVVEGQNITKAVRMYYVQIPATYKYVFGRKRGYDHEVFSPYVFGSARIGYPFAADVSFFREQEDGSMVEEDLVTFVTTGGFNQNEEQIELLGNPEKDRHLFSWLDIDIEVGGGYQYFITRTISLFAEAHIVYGILDINASEWRFRNNHNTYAASHNLYGGIKVGANFYLYKNNRG